MNMQVEVLKSKIHRVTITQANLSYVGSITVDEDLLDAAHLIAGEKVPDRQRQQRRATGDLYNQGRARQRRRLSERTGGPQVRRGRRGDHHFLCAHGFRGSQKLHAMGGFSRHGHEPADPIESAGQRYASATANEIRCARLVRSIRIEHRRTLLPSAFDRRARLCPLFSGSAGRKPAKSDILLWQKHQRNTAEATGRSVRRKIKLCEQKGGTGFHLSRFPVPEPKVGLEPTTFSLRMKCSTD